MTKIILKEKHLDGIVFEDVFEVDCDILCSIEHILDATNIKHERNAYGEISFKDFKSGIIENLLNIREYNRNHNKEDDFYETIAETKKGFIVEYDNGKKYKATLKNAYKQFLEHPFDKGNYVIWISDKIREIRKGVTRIDGNPIDVKYINEMNWKEI